MSDAAPRSVLVVDDEDSIRKVCVRMLSPTRRVLEAGTLAEAEDKLRSSEVDVCLCDIQLPDGDALKELGRLRRASPRTEFIVMTGQGGVAEAVAAVKAGAYDFLPKPFDPLDRVPIAVEKALERRDLQERATALEREAARRDGFDAVLGTSPLMRRAIEIARQAAPTSAAMLVLGESGTGKEVLARAIHQASLRARAPFVVVNCGAIPEALVESELFGHQKGSFTGAVRDKAGLFEEAHKGTILLDEVGEMPLPAQVALLRVLQSGDLRRVGSSQSRTVDVRVIAATNVDLKAAIKEKKFREDLYYRLNVISVELPSLRQRRDDVPTLALHFLRKAAQKAGKPVRAISDAALGALVSWSWPGNVRELENVVERAVVLARGEEIDVKDLPDAMFEKRDAAPNGSGGDAQPGAGDAPTLSYKDARDRVIAEFERGYVAALLRATDGNMAAAAMKAGFDRSNFRKLVVRSGIDFREYLPRRVSR